MSNTKTTKRPAAQVAASKKAAAMKAAAKRSQPLWLQQRLSLPAVLESDPPPAPERLSVSHQSQGPPRLLDKADVMAVTNVTFPTIWAWMRAGTFPRSRIAGGKSVWLSTEIEEWIAQLPRRPLKGDAPMEAA